MVKAFVAGRHVFC